MCDVCEQKHRSNRTLLCLVVVLFVIAGGLSVLVARFNHLLNDANDLTRTNHRIACDVDTVVRNGTIIYECRDIKGGSK